MTLPTFRREVLASAPGLAGKLWRTSLRQMVEAIAGRRRREEREARIYAEKKRFDFYSRLNAMGHAVTVGIGRALDGKAWKHIDPPPTEQQQRSRAESLAEREQTALEQEAAYIAKLKGNAYGEA